MAELAAMESAGRESPTGTAESASAAAHSHPAAAPESPPCIGGDGKGKGEPDHENDPNDRLPQHRFPDHVAPLPRIPSRG